MIINWIGSPAAIGIQDHYVNDTANYYFSSSPAGGSSPPSDRLSLSAGSDRADLAARRAPPAAPHPWLAVVRVGFIG